MNTEPAILIGALGALAASALALLIAFGVPITDDQKLATLAFVAVLVPVLTGIFTRSQVVPVAKVAATFESGELVVVPTPTEPPGVG